PRRLELHRRRGGVTVRLLPPRHQRLPEQTTQRFPPVQPQVSRPLRQTEQLLRPWRPQPLKVRRQFLAVELVPPRRRREDTRRQARRIHFGAGKSPPVRRPQPSILAPSHLLDRRLPAQGTPPAPAQR